MTILSDLHSAADRAEIVNRRGASPKQIEFLASLMEQCGKDARDIGCECTHIQTGQPLYRRLFG